MKQELSQSTPRARSATETGGFSLIEVILTTAIFALFIVAFAGAYLYGQEATATAGSRARAALLAEEGLEAVRNIRDASFANLTNGTYGLTTTSNQWNLFGTQDTADVFTRQIQVSPVDANRKAVIATVTWQQNQQRSGTVSLVTYFTNWAQASGGGPPTTCAEYCQTIGYTTGTCRKGKPQCTANGEIFENGGNHLCTQETGGTCCCLP